MAVKPLRSGLLPSGLRTATGPQPLEGVRQPGRALLGLVGGTSPAEDDLGGPEMSELTRTRSIRSARGVAAALAALGLTLTGVVVEARVADRDVAGVRTEAPSMLKVTGNQAPGDDVVVSEARDKLADLKGQWKADPALGAMARPVRTCRLGDESRSPRTVRSRPFSTEPRRHSNPRYRLE